MFGNMDSICSTQNRTYQLQPRELRSDINASLVLQSVYEHTQSMSDALDRLHSTSIPSPGIFAFTKRQAETRDTNKCIDTKTHHLFSTFITFLIKYDVLFAGVDCSYPTTAQQPFKTYNGTNYNVGFLTSNSNDVVLHVLNSCIQIRPHTKTRRSDLCNDAII